MLYSKKVKIYRENKMQNESNDNNNELLVKRSVIFILGMAGLLFMAFCAKFGYTVGEVLGELLYNLKH